MKESLDSNSTKKEYPGLFAIKIEMPENVITKIASTCYAYQNSTSQEPCKIAYGDASLEDPVDGWYGYNG